MIWRYTFTDRNGNKTVVDDEPVAWDGIGQTLSRDQDTHGLTFAFSANSLRFIEQSYWIIYEEYLLYGPDGYMALLIEWRCEDCPAFRVYVDGKLNFLTYKRFCGADCYITCGFDQSDKAVLLKNRWNTSVDLGSTLAYDGITPLATYAGLNKEITIPSKAIYKQSKANTTNPEGNTDYNLLLDADFPTFLDDSTARKTSGFILPKFDNISITELNEFTPSYQFDYFEGNNYEPAQIFTVADDADLQINNTYRIDTLLQGKLFFEYWNNNGGSVKVKLTIAIKYGPSFIDLFVPVQVEDFFDAVTDVPQTHEFNFSFPYTGDVQLNLNEKVYPVILLEKSELASGNFPAIKKLSVSFTNASYFNISSATVVAATTAPVNLIHETGARLVESITNNELTFKSEHYGRTDSQPLAYTTDGCGSLRAFTNGLQLRKALLQDNTNPNPFLSFKQFFEDQNCIDLVGIGVEDNKYVRMEPIRYFYKDIIVFVADGVESYEESVMQDRIYNNFKFGFDKYETESTNGLDAIHTKREYRINLRNTDKGLEKYCKTIYDGYAGEVTRRKVGTTEDWRYDQNIFGFCLMRTADGFAVEQGNIIDAVNMFDPATVINFRVTPVRNAMRWFKWLMQGFRKVTQTSRMLFNSGEGNYVAKGMLPDDACRIEASNVSENMPIGLDNYADQEEAKPFIVPEKIVFTYPLGMHEFLGLKSQAYGLIQYRQNPDDDWRFGWIDNLEPDHEGGKAKFTLVSAMYKGYALEGIRGLATEDYYYILTEGGAYIPLEGETIPHD